MLHPNNDLVAAAWCKTIPGVPVNQVAMMLPEDNSTWAASGFVVLTTVGGTPGEDHALRQPVITFDCWACSPSSVRPPWGKANALAEAIIAGHYSHSLLGVLQMPNGYVNARVLSTLCLAEPRRMAPDSAGYARYQVDLQLFWTEA